MAPCALTATALQDDCMHDVLAARLVFIICSDINTSASNRYE